MLVIFDPTRTAASHPPTAARDLVDPEDWDELSQILYPLPTTKNALNLILGTMGTAKGIMAFSQSLAHNSTPCAFHSIKTAKKRTVIYQPQRDTFLLVVFPADSRVPEPMIEETVRAAWDTATLLFGPEPWNKAASEWWEGFEHRIGDSVEQAGMKGWVSGGVAADCQTADGEDEQAVTAQLEALQSHVTQSIAPVTASYAISLPDPSTDPTTDPNPTIYQSSSAARLAHRPLIRHLLDLLHTSQPPTPTAPISRNRQRSPAAEKQHHQASKWTTLSLGTGISLFPSSRSTTPSGPQSTSPNPTPDPKPKGIASWFGLGSSTSPSQDRQAITEDPVPITPVDVPALDEALGSAQPIDVRWDVREVFLPCGDEDTQQEDGLARRVLAFAIHARTLVAFILEPPPDQQLTDLSARLNNPSSTAIHSTLSDLFRAIQSPSNARTETPPPRDTQYIHSTSNPPGFASNWKSHEVVSAPTKEPSISGKSRPRREVTVDALGVYARDSLSSIDDAREFFARTGNDVWIVGSRVSGSCRSVADGKEAEGEEAYVVVQGKETSIVDAEYQLRKILKGQM